MVRIVPAQIRGTAIGGFAAFQNISYAVTGPLSGALASTTGFASVYLAASMCAVLGLGTTYLFKTKQSTK